MHVLILTIGSRGDVQPFLALSAGLVAAGHRVTLATSPRFRDDVEKAGAAFAPLSDELVALAESPLGRGLFEAMGGSYRRALWEVAKVLRRIDPMQRDLVAGGWAAARAARPDAIVYHPKMAGAPSYAERLGVPAILGVLFPQLVPTGAYPAVGFPDLGWPALNRLTYRVVLGISGAFARRYAGPWRRAHGLPPDRTDYLHRADGAPIPVLHGFSRHVVPVPPDQPARVATTGFWFLDHSDDYLPPAELRAFLDAGVPPVYVGWGSMAARDPEWTTQVVLEAVRQAGVRAVVATGWGGLTEADLPPGVLRIRAAPHDWLFPRCAAVVHHGGAGTTAAGLRAGKPTVICPFFGDQPFWGRRVHELGAGPPPVGQKELTADRLAAGLAAVTTDGAMRARAETLGARMRAEDGVAQAVAEIERIAG